MRDYSDPTRGDKRTLRADELDILENEILPTARRWLASPGLREHAVKTLVFWGEQIPQEYRQ